MSKKKFYLDTPPNPCGSNPCKNGGFCRNSGSSFICDCQPQYAGTFCENCLLRYLLDHLLNKSVR